MTLCFNAACGLSLLHAPIRSTSAQVRTRPARRMRHASMQAQPPRTSRSAALLRTPEAVVAILIVGLSLVREVLRGDGAGVIARIRARIRTRALYRARTESLRCAAGELRLLSDAARAQQERLSDARQRAAAAHADAAAKRSVAADIAIARLLVAAVRATGEEVGDDALADAVASGGPLRQLAEYAREAQDARALFDQYVNDMQIARRDIAKLDRNSVHVDDAHVLAKRSVKETHAAVISRDAAIAALTGAEEDVHAREAALVAAEKELTELLAVIESREKSIKVQRDAVEVLERGQEDGVEVRVAAQTDAVGSAMQLRRLKKEVHAGRALAASIMQGARVAVENANTGGDASDMQAIRADLQEELMVTERGMLDAQRKLDKRETRVRASRARSVMRSSVLEEADRSDKSDVLGAVKRNADKSDVKTADAAQHGIATKLESGTSAEMTSVGNNESEESSAHDGETPLENKGADVTVLREKQPDALGHAEAVQRRAFLRMANSLKPEDFGLKSSDRPTPPQVSTPASTDAPVKKRGRGRPRKIRAPEADVTMTDATPVKRGRGRPRKNAASATEPSAENGAAASEEKVKRGRGRPRKTRP